MWCYAVRYCAVGYGTVWCGAVRGFAVRGVGFSNFRRLCLLISDNFSDHALVFLVFELLFILFRKGLCQQVM